MHANNQIYRFHQIFVHRFIYCGGEEAFFDHFDTELFDCCEGSDVVRFTQINPFFDIAGGHDVKSQLRLFTSISILCSIEMSDNPLYSPEKDADDSFQAE
jgi:hypothetical protein